MEMEEVVKILIVVVVLIILIGAVIFLFKGKGGELLASIKNVLRFGGK
jgi:preprotein translocase subunit SecG